MLIIPREKSSRFYIFRSVFTYIFIFTFANKISHYIWDKLPASKNYIRHFAWSIFIWYMLFHAFTCYALNKFIVTQIQTHTYSFTKERFGLQSIYNIFPLLDKSFMYIIDYAHI